MKEAQSKDQGMQNEPGTRRGWRDDEFARHEVYTQLFWVCPWLVIMAIAAAFWLMRSCAAQSATP